MKSKTKDLLRIQYCLLPLVITLCIFFVLSGCIADHQGESLSPNVTKDTPAPNETSVVATVATTVVTPPTPARTEISTTIPENTTLAADNRELYHDNIAIFMDRKGYEILPFEDFGVPLLVPGERYIVRITSDHAIFAYVLPQTQVDLLQTTDGTPIYNPDMRTYDYGSLTPIFKMEDVYESGGEFKVKEGGKYVLVLDTRLSERDYKVYNEVTKVAVRVLKEN
jgi:hypothetical protein